MSDRDQEKFGDDESQKRFEAALRGARDASSHPMSEFVGKGKCDGVKRKSEVKRTAQARPK